MSIGPLRILLACRAITSVASMAAIPFLIPHLTKVVGLSLKESTTALTMLVVLPAVASPAIGHLQDRMSARLMLSLASLAQAGALAALACGAGGRAGAFAWLAMIASSIAVTGVSASTAVARYVSAGELPLGFSSMHAVGNVGWLIGPAAAGLFLMNGHGTPRIYWLAASVQLTGTFLYWLALPREAAVAATMETTLAGDSPAAAFPLQAAYGVVTLLMWANFEQTGSFLSKYADGLGSPAMAGFYFSAQAVPVIFLVPLAGRMMKGWSTKRLLRAFSFGIILSPLGFLALSIIAPRNIIAGLIVMGTLVLMDEMLSIPSAGTLAAHLAPRGKFGAVFGWRASIIGLGRAAGIGVGGYILQNGAAGHLFWAYSGAALLTFSAGAAVLARHATQPRSAANSVPEEIPTTMQGASNG